MKTITLTILALVLVLPAYTGAQAGFDHTHGAFDALLAAYVEDGRVDYAGLREDPGTLDAYLTGLATADTHGFDGWSRAQKLAFWINAYNAFTLKAVIDHYPIEGSAFSLYPRNSIRQIKGVWDELTFAAAGREVTLNEIEHGILRAQLAEPRIHFALVCASLGCPVLGGGAYAADTLERQLTDASRRFVNDSEKVTVDADRKKVVLSKIFKWFGSDFVPAYSGGEHFQGRNKMERAVLNFVRLHLTDPDKKRFITEQRVSISYSDYDWSLNEGKPGT